MNRQSHIRGFFSKIDRSQLNSRLGGCFSWTATKEKSTVRLPLSSVNKEAFASSSCKEFVLERLRSGKALCWIMPSETVEPQCFARRNDLVSIRVAEKRSRRCMHQKSLVLLLVMLKGFCMVCRRMPRTFLGFTASCHHCM